MVEKTRDDKTELPKGEESPEEPEMAKEESHFDKIYSKVASNGYENLRTSYIENKAKELSKRRR